MQIGDVVVHKSLGNVPLVVVGLDENIVAVRYGSAGQHGVSFVTEQFIYAEVETPVESIAREAIIFQALNDKRAELEAPKLQKGPQPVN